MDDAIRAIKERLDLVELISAYVSLRRAGSTWKGLCPFHAEKTPSFVVDPQRGFWRCYGCQAGGDAFSFLQQIENLSFVEAAEKLARRVGVEFVPRGRSGQARTERERLLRLHQLALQYFRRQLELSPHARAYLESRGLTAETIARFQLGYAPPDWEGLIRGMATHGVDTTELIRAGLATTAPQGPRDRFVDRIVFPIWSPHGEVVAFAGRALRSDQGPKYLNSPETPLFHKGQLWYALHLAREAIQAAGYAIAVEGYMDVIACHQAGIGMAIAGMGTAITEGQVRLLHRYTQQLVLAYDGDSAGLRAALRAAPMFEEAGMEVRVAALPAGEDPDALLRREGAAGFHAIVAASRPLLEYRIRLLRERYNLSDREQRRRMVREAAQAIAESRSPLTRQEYVARLGTLVAELASFSGAELQRDEQAALLAEARQIALRTRDPGGTPDRGRRRASAPGAAVRLGGLAPPQGLALAQRWALRAVFEQPERIALLRARLRPDHFDDAPCHRLAVALLGNNGGEAASPEAVLADPAYAREASALLLSEDPAIDDAAFRACIDYLERAAKQRRLHELQREFARGTLSHADQRYEEYLELVKELKG